MSAHVRIERLVLETKGTRSHYCSWIDSLLQISGIPRISRVIVIGFPRHSTLRGNYQECVSEDKDDLRLGLQRLRSHALRDSFLKYKYIVPQVRVNKWALFIFY